MNLFGQIAELTKAIIRSAGGGNFTIAAPSSASNQTATLPDATGTVLEDSATQAFTNKTVSDALTFAEIATPSNPASGFVKLYAKGGDALYWLTPGGVETQIGTGGGGSLPLTTLGDTLYENATPAPARLAGNITTTKQYLSQTGTGAVSAAPAWSALSAGDLQSGQVSIARGGTGQATASAGFAALSPMTTLGDMIYEDGTPVPVRLAGNISTTKQFLTQTGTGVASAAPAWGGVTGNDVLDNITILSPPMDITLNTTSDNYQILTPSATINVTLNNSFFFGQSITIKNASNTNTMTVLANNAATIVVINQGQIFTFKALVNAPGNTSQWTYEQYATPATATASGIVTTTAQTLAGSKTFNDPIVASASSSGIAVEVARASPNSTDVQNVYSGVYTPTTAGVINVSDTTTFQMIWYRVGNMVTVAGRIDSLPTAAGGTDTVFSMTLPITMGSNFSSSDTQGAGTFHDHVGGQTMSIYPNNGSKLVYFEYNATSAGYNSFFGSFTYQIQP